MDYAYQAGVNFRQTLRKTVDNKMQAFRRLIAKEAEQRIAQRQPQQIQSVEISLPLEQEKLTQKFSQLSTNN